MIILALDGALGAFSAAVTRDDRAIASVSEAGNVALERGLAIANGVMREARVDARDLDRLAVGIGPGTFTGLRVAIAYAKSLAAAWRRPLVPISSFDILEYGYDFERVLAVVVGRPGVISARYRRDAEIRRASGRVADVLHELFPAQRSAAAAETLAVVGAPKDVLHALAERRISVNPVVPAVMPAAAAAALAAASRVPPPSVHEVTADYGELPAARVPKL